MEFVKKRVLWSSLLFFCLVLCLAFQPPKKYRRVPNDSFLPGEQLVYRLHYGFVNAGEATVGVDPQYYSVNDRVCYKVNIIGRSTGSFDLVMKIRDQFTTYLDTSAMYPHKFFRIIREGKYKLDETIYFDQLNHTARLKQDSDPEKITPTPPDIHDIVSGYYFLRTINYDTKKLGDTISVNAYFEAKVYDFKVKYLGKDVIDTKFGKIRALKLSPIMPENEMFKGGHSIRLWMSDDKNHVPLKVEALLFIGSVDLDLKSYSGLRWPLALVK
jgi:hypothetical protein